MTSPQPTPRALAARPDDPLPSTIDISVSERAAAERAVAAEVLELVRERGVRGEGCLLGLATGGTMVGVYAALVAAARAEGVSFAHVYTVNLDEYLGLGLDDPRSFAAYMREHLFEHLIGPLGLDPARTLVPDGARAASAPVVVAREVEAFIARHGGIDLQLLGIGRNGHLAFNEPGASHRARTRVVALARETREDAAAAFGGLAHAPRRALTLGLGTILDARRLRVLAFGRAKARAVAEALRGPVDRRMPASALQRHPDVRMWLDAESAQLVSRTPDDPRG